MENEKNIDVNNLPSEKKHVDMQKLKAVEDALMGLFASQGLSTGGNNYAIFSVLCETLMQKNFTKEAIKNGIKTLHERELRRITVSAVLEAINEYKSEKREEKENIYVDCKLCGEVINAPCFKCQTQCYGTENWKTCVDFQNAKRNSTGLVHAKDNKTGYSIALACSCEHGTKIAGSMKIQQFNGRRMFFYGGSEFAIELNNA